MIELMKFDMGGAAATLGAAAAVAQLDVPDIEVHFIARGGAEGSTRPDTRRGRLLRNSGRHHHAARPPCD